MIPLLSIGVGIMLLAPFAPDLAVIFGGVWLVAVVIAHVAECQVVTNRSRWGARAKGESG